MARGETSTTTGKPSLGEALRKKRRFRVLDLPVLARQPGFSNKLSWNCLWSGVATKEAPVPGGCFLPVSPIDMDQRDDRVVWEPCHWPAKDKVQYLTKR